MTTCLHRCVSYLLSNALVRTKIWKKWFYESSGAKGENFFWRGIHKYPEIWENWITSATGHALNKTLFNILKNLTCLFRKIIRISYLYTRYTVPHCLIVYRFFNSYYGLFWEIFLLVSVPFLSPILIELNPNQEPSCFVLCHCSYHFFFCK